MDAKVPSELLQAAALSIEGSFSGTESGTNGAIFPIPGTRNVGSLDPGIRALLYATRQGTETPVIQQIIFDSELVNFPDVTAEVRSNTAKANVSIYYNPALRGDHVATLGALAVNEFTHQDARAGTSEEIVSSLFEALTHLKNLQLVPSLADLATFMTRVADERVMLMLNSGSRGNAIGLNEAPLRGQNNPFGTSDTFDLAAQLESRSFTGFNRLFYDTVEPRNDIHTGMNDTIGEMIEFVTGQPFREFNNQNGGVFNVLYVP